MPRNILGLGKFSLHLLVGATTARRRRHRPTPSPPPDAVAAARRLAVAAARPTDAGAAPPARALPKGCTILNASKAALILIAVGSEEAKQSGSGASDTGLPFCHVHGLSPSELNSPTIQQEVCRSALCSGLMHQQPPSGDGQESGALPPGWLAHWCDRDNSYYYHNQGTDELTWDRPCAAPPVPPVDSQPFGQQGRQEQGQKEPWTPRKAAKVIKATLVCQLVRSAHCQG